MAEVLQETQEVHTKAVQPEAVLHLHQEVAEVLQEVVEAAIKVVLQAAVAVHQEVAEALQEVEEVQVQVAAVQAEVEDNFKQKSFLTKLKCLFSNKRHNKTKVQSLEIYSLLWAFVFYLNLNVNFVNISK